MYALVYVDDGDHRGAGGERGDHEGDRKAGEAAEGAQKMSRCRGCGAEIEWIKTPAGENMPIDPEPVFVLAAKDGKGVFLTDEGEVFRGKAVESGEGAEVGFVPHWATCRAPAQFRR